MNYLEDLLKELPAIRERHETKSPVLAADLDITLQIISLLLEELPGPIPPVPPEERLKRLIAATNAPIVTDVYQSDDCIFFVSFALRLWPDDIARLKAAGIEVSYDRSPLPNRYMLTWDPESRK